MCLKILVPCTRYYYYRCTSTHHKGWDACSTKQVNADRLEKYILENLERISLDKSYIENLVFKLNHSSNTDTRSGHEPSQVCSKFDPESISSTLKSFISYLSSRRGLERNLLAKRFIRAIVYSKELIKITLFYSENSKNFQVSQTKGNPALFSQGRAIFSERSEVSSLPPEQNKFVSNIQAAILGLEPII